MGKLQRQTVTTTRPAPYSTSPTNHAAAAAAAATSTGPIRPQSLSLLTLIKEERPDLPGTAQALTPQTPPVVGDQQPSFAAGASSAPAASAVDAAPPATVKTEPTSTSTPATLQSPVEETPSFSSDQKQILEWLECPVCLDFPREAPLHACKHGHITCSSCYVKLPSPEKTGLKTCPTCRDPLGQRNIFAERVLALTLEKTPLRCRNHREGCPKTDLASRLAVHEQQHCLYREVTCTASHRAACTYSGPLGKILQHTIEKKCAQIIKINTATDGSAALVPEEFTSVIGDFSQQGLTVFNRRQTPTHWKPVLLMSKRLLRLFPYLLIYREPAGQWILCVRAYACQSVIEQYRVRVSVKACSTEENKTTPVYTYDGELSSHDDSKEKVLESGKFLSLCDQQVRLLGEDTMILKFVVQFTLKENAAASLTESSSASSSSSSSSD